MAHQPPDLSETDIEKLLLEAEQRLATQGNSKTKPERGELTRHRPTATTSTQQPRPAKEADNLTVRTPEFLGKNDKTSQGDAGPDWNHMPKTDLAKDPALKRDLQILKLRGILDAKQHFRKDARKDFVPTFCQRGVLVEGPLEVNNRLTRKERKRTIVEEVLGLTDANTKFRTRYNEIQTRKMSGRKGHYKKLVAQRRRGH